MSGEKLSMGLVMDQPGFTVPVSLIYSMPP